MSAYREEVAQALADGCRFASLHASDQTVRAVLMARDGRPRLVEVTAPDRHIASIVDLVPAANWDEREAADVYGIRFGGHEPLRPLVDHDLDLGSWTVPVRGNDAYQVAVGPIHAGVIESGHFRFHVVGDRILHLDVRLFYKHRGLERAAEGANPDGGLAYAQRACAACAVSNTVAYAHAWEDALGSTPTDELARGRTIRLELERLWSHLNDIAAICAGVGLAAGNNRFAGLTERARRLNAALTGHRFLFHTVAVGGSNLHLDADKIAFGRAELDALRDESRSAWRELLFNASFQARLPDVGVISSEDARLLGASQTTRAQPVRASPTTASRRSRRGGPQGTSRHDSSSAPSSCCRPSRSSKRSSTGRSPLQSRTAATTNARSVSATSRAHVAPPSASSSGTRHGSNGSACAPAPTPTGPSSRTPQPETCCPTSH